MLQLSVIPEIVEVPSFSDGAKSFLQGLIDDFSVEDASEVKNIERVTNHDVKAVEYFLKQKCQSNAEVAKVGIHFCVSLYSEAVHCFTVLIKGSDGLCYSKPFRRCLSFSTLLAHLRI